MVEEGRAGRADEVAGDGDRLSGGLQGRRGWARARCEGAGLLLRLEDHSTGEVIFAQHIEEDV